MKISKPVFNLACIFVLWILTWSLPSSAVAREKGPVDIGHNVSATSWTFKKGQCTVGVQVAGCGINDRTSLAFSPWLLKDYRIANLALRYLIDENAEGDRWAVQTAYFSTWNKRGTVDLGGAEFPDGRYQMQALWLMGIRSWAFDDDYNLHLNFHANYYFDETLPFSLRRPYMQNTPFQFNLTTLHEMDLAKNWVIKGEIGLLDVLRAPMHFHSGVSIGRKTTHWHWHIGFSMTSTYFALGSPLQRYDYQQGLRAYDLKGYETEEKSEYGVKYDFSIHPEFALQYFF